MYTDDRTRLLLFVYIIAYNMWQSNIYHQLYMSYVFVLNLNILQMYLK
jgi:F0F1-type ATP synthase assembly protein I